MINHQKKKENKTKVVLNTIVYFYCEIMNKRQLFIIDKQSINIF